MMRGEVVKTACLAAVFWVSSLGAIETDAQSTGVFSRLGFGARGMSMGNAMAGDASGNASPYYNPALSPYTTRQNLSASAALLRFDRELQFLQFAAPVRPRAGIGVGLVHAGVNNIDGRDGSGFHTRDLSTDEFAFFLSFGLIVSEGVSIGVGLQLFRSDLLPEVDPVRTVGVDVGITGAVLPNLRLGLVVEDLLAKYNWDSSGAFGTAGRTTRDLFPRRVRLGASLDTYGGNLRVNVEHELRIATLEARSNFVQVINGIPVESFVADEVTRATSTIRAGAEYRLVDAFSARGGFDRLGADGISGIAPSLGFMVEQPLGNLLFRGEYAMILEPDAAAAMHILTLRLFL